MVARKVWWRPLCERHPMFSDLRLSPNTGVYRGLFPMSSRALGAECLEGSV